MAKKVTPGELSLARQVITFKAQPINLLRELSRRQVEHFKHWENFVCAIDETDELTKIYIALHNESRRHPEAWRVNVWAFSRLILTEESIDLLLGMANHYCYWRAIQKAAGAAKQLPISASAIEAAFDAMSDEIPCPADLRFKDFGDWTIAQVQANLKGSIVLEIAGHSYDFRYLLNPLLVRRAKQRAAFTKTGAAA